MGTLQIPLTQDKFALVDAEDYDRVARHKWSWQRCKRGSGYAGRTTIRNGQRTTCLLHRFVLNAPDGKRVDHKNGNGLDCRKHNLRYATAQQNFMNRVPSAGSLSQYKNVTVSETRRIKGKDIPCTWRVVVTRDRVRYDLGRHKDLLWAIRVADAGMIRLHGEFARPNLLSVDPDAVRYVDDRLARKT